MVLFRSEQPDVEVPEDLTTWDWLFEPRDSSPLYSKSNKPLGAFVDAETQERLDWAEVKAKSTALSTCLVKQYGLCLNDTITLLSGNSIWYPVCMFAVIRAGGRINGASPALTVDEMAYLLKAARTKILITALSSLDRALAAAQQVGMPTSHVLLIQGKAESLTSVQDLIEDGAMLESEPPFRLPAGTTNRALCGYLNFSSGTTGLPKAVMMSHYNIIAQCYQMRQLQIDPDNVKILAIMPLFHVTGTWRFCHYPILMNGDAIMLPAFSLPAMLNATVRFQVEELILVPPILLRLARDPTVDQFDLRHLQRWTSGAAPISPEVLKALQNRFPWTGFRQGYGATEAAFISANPPTCYDYKYGVSVGKLVSNTVAKVIDPTGKELGPGETGEILVKGPQVALGYLDNDNATVESFDPDGFYHTGDAGCFDEEGWIYIKDRIKEMIKVKGSQVPPAELEDLLLGHADVDDCAVISIPDEYAGELPKAYIVLKNGVPSTDGTGQNLLEYVKKNKVRYKWLAEVEFVEKIPKSPAGKLLRRVLKDGEQARLKDDWKGTTGYRVQSHVAATERGHDHKTEVESVSWLWYIWHIVKSVITSQTIVNVRSYFGKVATQSS